MASEAELQQFYLGQDIAIIPKPAAILDAAIIRRHCRDMLQTIQQLNVGFRAHIKSHKVHITLHTTAGKVLIGKIDNANRTSPSQRQPRPGCKLHRIDDP